MAFNGRLNFQKLQIFFGPNLEKRKTLGDFHNLSRLIAVPKSCSSASLCGIKMPYKIEWCVRKQNIHFMHNKNQFSAEYFQFMRKLLTHNQPYVTLQPGMERLVSGSKSTL